MQNFLLNIPMATGSNLNSVHTSAPYESRWSIRDFQVPASQLLTKTIVIPVDKSNSKIHLQADIIFIDNAEIKVNKLFRKSYQTYIIQIRVRYQTAFLNIDPLRCTTFRTTKLKRSQDRRSPGLKHRTLSKGLERTFSALIKLLILLKVILHSLICFAEISDFVANMQSLIRFLYAANI